MPLVPNNGKLFIDLDSPESVDQLVETARGIDPSRLQRFFAVEQRIVADIADHLLYLSATSPEWFAPYREEAVGELHDRLPMDIGVSSILLDGTSDVAAHSVRRRLKEAPESWHDLTLLAGIGTEAASTALADHVRHHPEAQQWTNRLGVHVPPSGPAVRRFTNERFAIVDADTADDGMIGLDLAQVTNDEAITWHYLSFKPSLVLSLPDWAHDLLHIVSPRSYWFTLHAVVDSSGRYIDPVVDFDGEPSSSPAMLEVEAAPPPSAGLVLRRYDSDLTYRNGHILMTPGAHGTAGGPPVGLYPNPVCRECGVLMFHGASIASTVREYGEGFVSVFYCERCTRVAVTGTNWN